MNSLFERIDKLDTNLRISSEWAKRKYNEFNTRFFGGRLPKNISFEMSGTTNAVGDASKLYEENKALIDAVSGKHTGW